MNPPTTDYWFRPCDDAASPSVEWHRQVGVAIAAAAGALAGCEENVIEIYTGTITGHPDMRRLGLVTAEVVSFRGTGSGLVEGALRGLGSSRQVTVTRDDAVSLVRLAQFGFPTASYVSPAAAAAGGYVFPNTFSLGAAIRDRNAKAGSVLAVARCPESAGGSALLDANATRTEAYQSIPALAQTIHRRLIKLREGSIAAGLTAPAEAGTVAKQAVAETRAAFGGKRIALDLDSPGTVTLSLMGFRQRDLGSLDSGEIASQLGLVLGTSIEAECAIGQRNDCTSSPLSPYATAIVDLDDPANSALRSSVASDGLMVTASFAVRMAAGDTATIHLVQKTRSGLNGPMGEVLATFAVAPGMTSGAATSGDYQLADSVWSAASAVPAHDQPGGGNIGKPQNSCLGRKHSPYVPLQNELTGSGDNFEASWQHYLAQAKTAADRADQLGRQLIDEGLQKDLRREGAGEALAGICGDYAAASNVNFDNSGNVSAAGGDEALSVCLDEPSYDVVLLTALPTDWGSKTPSQKNEFVSNLLQCSGGGAQTKLCNTLGDGATIQMTPAASPPDPHTVYFGALGLGPYDAAPTDASPPNCAPAAEAVQSLSQGMSAAAINQELLGLDQGTIGLALANLQFVRASDLHWSVTYLGTTLMDSHPGASQWPGCLLGGGPCDANAESFARMFQHGGVHAVPASGMCEAGYFQAGSTCLLSLANGALSADGFIPQHELALYMWRVQGALWTLANATGGVPAGLFSVQIRMAMLDWTTPAGSYYPSPTVIGNGNFVSAGAPFLVLQDTHQPPGNEIGGVSFAGASGPSWNTFANANAGFEVPAWLALVDGNAGGYAAAQINVPALVSGTATNQTFHNQLTAAAKGLDGVACTDFHGMVAGRDQGWLALEAARHSHGAANAPEYCGMATCFTATSQGDSLSSDGIAHSSTSYQVCPDVGFTPGGAEMPVLPAWCDIGGYSISSLPFGQLSYWYTNSYPTRGACGATANLLQTVALGCHLQYAKLPIAVLDAPPEIDSVEKISALGVWLGAESKRVAQLTGKLYLLGVPGRVVDDFKKGTVGTGELKGEHGSQVLAFEQQTQALFQSWIQVAKDFALLRDAVQAANLQIQAADIKAGLQNLELARQSLSIHEATMKAYVQALGGALGVIQGAASGGNVLGGASDIADAAITANYAAQQLAVLNEIKVLEKNDAANAVAQALNDLNKNTQTAYSDLATAISTIRASTAAALDVGQQLAYSRDSAAYEAAKATPGQDFVTIDGQVVGLPVNAVLNRQYSMTGARYKQAFDDAKYSACLARLSIEQRLGVRLDSIKTQVGALKAPFGWADELNSATGIDYKAFACTPSSMSTCNSSETGAGLGKNFIGDYVAKLGDFVDYYNVDYPFHEGEDSVVISLAQDVLGGARACTRLSNNLLCNSSDLTTGIPGFPGKEGAGQWHVTGGDGVKSLTVYPQKQLASPNDGPDQIPGPPAKADAKLKTVSWLRESLDSTVSQTTPEPPNFVYQTVSLSPGSYVFSWWAQSRDANGGLVVGPQAYTASVFDASWTPVASRGANAPEPGDGTNWGARTSLAVSISVAGDYRVGFSAAAGDPGSLAVALVQLEQVPSINASAGPYEGTGPNREVLVSGGQCYASPGDVRAAFEHVQVGSGWAYRLKSSMIIALASELKNAAGVPLAQDDKSTGGLGAKFAQGNYNYRHEGLVLNLVGTGVHDCAIPSPSCYASGFEEYSVTHVATAVPISNPVDGNEVFDFETQAISHAKALSAEKYLTIPLASSDNALISQPGLEKVELQGRPVNGEYGLLIHDSPSLRWDRLEDVQILVRYRYWAHTFTKKPGSP